MTDWWPVHFLRPAWLLAMPLAVLLPLAWRHWRRPSGDWARVCDPHLLRWLSVGEMGRKPGRLGLLAAISVLLIASLALAGPSWQRLPDSSYSARDARVLVLDLSLSMLAEDLKPNRLTRVRFRLADLLRETEEGQVGLVAYAGDAYVVSPLTRDTNTIANMLPALRPDVMPVAGSRAERALELAAQLLERSGLGRGEILLVTDDVDDAAIDVAARLSRDGIVTSVLAVGTPEGAPIPSGSGFVSDAQGNVVIARLGRERLERLAAAGQGRLTVLGPDNRATQPWQAGSGAEFGLRDDSLGERWKDAGPWLVLLLLPLVALGFRRGVLFGLAWLVTPLLLHVPAAQAGLWEDLWQRRDQQAQEALRAERPGQAASLARDPAIAGEAWYRAGEYERAMSAWSGLDQAAAHYNRGNALAHAGDLPGALQAYDQALAMRPDFEDALYNKALVEQLQQQQQQEQQSEDANGEGQQPEGEQQQSDQQSGQGEQQQDESEGEGEPQESEGGEQQQPGEQGEEQVAQAWTEEDAQAMEQWLRRIPDDPGGLLRRKFRNEHLRRGTPPEPARTW